MKNITVKTKAININSLKVILYKLSEIQKILKTEIILVNEAN